MSLEVYYGDAVAYFDYQFEFGDRFYQLSLRAEGGYEVDTDLLPFWEVDEDYLVHILKVETFKGGAKEPEGLTFQQLLIISKKQEVIEDVAYEELRKALKGKYEGL